MREIKLILTKTKRCSLWECGTVGDDGGSSFVVCGRNGEKLEPFFINNNAYERALLPVEEGYLVVEAQCSSISVDVKIYEVTDIRTKIEASKQRREAEDDERPYSVPQTASLIDEDGNRFWEWTISQPYKVATLRELYVLHDSVWSPNEPEPYLNNVISYAIDRCEIIKQPYYCLELKKRNKA